MEEIPIERYQIFTAIALFLLLLEPWSKPLEILKFMIRIYPVYYFCQYSKYTQKM